MSLMITGERLLEAVRSESFIKGGDPSSVEAVKYDFHMGSRVLKAAYGQPKEIQSIPEENRWVDPGEAVFILTRERLHLPANMVAVLTPKRKLAHSGIMMLGGLAVDPQYRGVLLIGLYNFSSTRYPLLADSKLIGAVFYELDPAEVSDLPCSQPEEITDFPEDLIRLIQNYKPVELKGLQDAVADTQRQLDNLKADLLTDKSWRDDFKESLSKHDQQLGTLINLLDKEQALRAQEDEKIRGRLDTMQNLFFGMRLGTWVLILAVTAIVGAVAGWYVPKLLDSNQVEPAAATALATSGPPARRP